MSAINDALRRASGAAPTTEPPPLPPIALPAGSPPGFGAPADSGPLSLEPGLPPLLQPPPKKGTSVPILVVVALLLAAASVAGIYLWKRSAASKNVVLKDSSRVVARAPAQKPTSAASSTEQKEEAKQPTQPAQPQQMQAVTSTPVKEVQATAAPASTSVSSRSPVQFPPLRLQGIYYKPSNPSVMINNRALFVGDQVQGVTVASIDASSVTLVLSGQTNVLTLR